MSRNGSKPAQKQLGALPRGSFHLARVSSLVTRKFDLVNRDGSVLRLTFGAIQKEDADEVAGLVAHDAPDDRGET